MTKEEILAEPAGPRMDEWVAEKVMGLCLHKKGWFESGEAVGPTTYSLLEVYSGHVGKVVHCKDCGHREVLGLGITAVIDFGLPEYSTDIAAAWEVVEKVCAHEDSDEDPLKMKKRYSSNASYGPWWNVEFLDGFHGSADAETAPLAICRAALLTTL